MKKLCDFHNIMNYKLKIVLKIYALSCKMLIKPNSKQLKENLGIINILEFLISKLKGFRKIDAFCNFCKYISICYFGASLLILQNKFLIKNNFKINIF